MLEPIGADRGMELEYMRMRKLYHTLLSEAIAYAEVDLESGQIKSVGGLWQAYKQDYRQSSRHFIEVLEQQLSHIISDEELERLRRYRDPAAWKEMLARGDQQPVLLPPAGGRRPPLGGADYLPVPGGYHPQYVHPYLSEGYQRGEGAGVCPGQGGRPGPADRPVQPHRFRAGGGPVRERVQSVPCGVLLILDIDNFKQINDKMGHLEGDKALQTVARALTATFRHEDIVGRLGGDEFLVFIRSPPEGAAGTASGEPDGQPGADGGPHTDRQCGPDLCLLPGLRL